MAEERSQDMYREKKEKTAVKKIVGNVQPSEEPEKKTPDKPAYEHG